MNKKLFYILVLAALLLSACGQAATEPPAPDTTEPPVAATEPPAAEPATEVPTEAGPCLIIGALYGGPITDAGYN